MTITRSQAESLLNHAKQTTDGGGWGSNDPFSRRIYIGKEATIRFHPYLDAQGRPFRVIYRHVVFEPKPIEILCLGDSCTICKTLKNMPGWSSKWKLQARRVGFGYAIVFNLTNVKVNFAWHDGPVLLLHKSYDSALSQILKKLGTAESVQKFFDPQSETPVVLARSASTPGNLSMELTHSSILRTWPNFSEGSKPLSDYLAPTDFDRGKESAFMAAVNSEWEREKHFISVCTTDPVPYDKCSDKQVVGTLEDASTTDGQETHGSEIDHPDLASAPDAFGEPESEEVDDECFYDADYDQYLDEFDSGEEALAEFEHWKKLKFEHSEPQILDIAGNDGRVVWDASGLRLAKKRN